jgi:hypothetical protein
MKHILLINSINISIKHKQIKEYKKINVMNNQINIYNRFQKHCNA